jgi:WD40 repeat protein
MVHQKDLGTAINEYPDPIRSMAFSQNNQLLASGSFGTITLWDVARRKSGEPLSGHKGFVTTVNFSHDLQLLASGGMDNFIRLWDVASRRPIGEPLTGHEAAVTSVTFSPDDKLLASAGGDGIIRLWDVDIESWIDRACHIVNRDLIEYEWRQFMGDLAYQKTCPRLPGPEEVKEAKEK